jgi:hypothetical protein
LAQVSFGEDIILDIGYFKGGMMGEGRGEALSCCLCGEQDYDKLLVHRIGIAVGYAGDDYSFCKSCWLGPNFGKRLLEFLGYPDGMYLKAESVEFKTISDEP